VIWVMEKLGLIWDVVRITPERQAQRLARQTERLAGQTERLAG
jgi:stearoyl-CoA desaturase (delta-9 desaturase)